MTRPLARRLPLLLGLLALVPVPGAAAHGVWAHCGALEIMIGDGNPETIYVVIDDPLTYGLSVWVYQESNGIQYLQRGDVVCDEATPAGVAADTILV